MTKLRLCTCLLLVWVGVVVAGLPARADDNEQRYTLDEAVTLVRNTYGGQVLQATSRKKGERLVYRIRVLTDDGHVRTFVVDADTGDVR